MDRIAAFTGISRASVSRILRREGLNRLRALQPVEPPQRYECRLPVIWSIENWRSPGTLEPKEAEMRKSRFTESQIVQTLKQVEGGRKVKDVCREIGVSEATYYQ